ncbi:MAG: YkgJ family cysteine cluster protein [Planctomycetes bacterium]|nr:YkgJ family cysteine cluster protein [Planctomycetota bacterium]
MPNAPALIFPPEVDYECTRCGRCCSHPWEIPLDAASAERIRSVDWSRFKPDLAGQPLVVPRSGKPGEMTLQRRGDSCVFLTPDQRCLVHQERGLEFKPRACQQFPYVFTETPRGIYVGVSFATRGIRSGTGTPLARHEEHLRALSAGAYHRRVIREPVVFDPDWEITFEDALALEGGLLELLRGDATSLEDDLVAGGVYLDLFGEFLRGERGRQRRPGPAFQEGWERLGYRRIREIAAKFRPSPAARRMFLTSFVMGVEAAFSPGSPAWHVARSLAAQVGSALRIGRIRLGSLQAILPLGAHSSVDFDPGNTALTDPLRLYLRHVLFRKRLIPFCGVRTGYRLLCIDFALVRWFAQARAALQGRRSVEPEDVPESIETVERYFVLHTRFDQVFEHAWLQKLLTRAARQKQFLGTMVRSE